MSTAHIFGLARRVWLTLRDEGGWHSTGKVVGLVASLPGLLDGFDSPRRAVEEALDLLYSCGHVACQPVKGLWAVTTSCKPLSLSKPVQIGPTDV